MDTQTNAQYVATFPTVKSTAGRTLLTWALWSALPLLTLGSAAIHNGRVLTILFTPLAVLIGFCFLFRSSTQYISYVITLFTFSAFIRRIADLFAGYTESSPIVSAPYLVAALAAILVVRRFRLSSRYLPFAVAALAVLYGFIIGVVSVGGLTVIKSALRWTVPLIFGMYCMQEADKEKLSNTFLRVTLICSIFAAFYGIVQFVLAPPWDTAWLSGMQAGGAGISFGSPAPFAIRVFSTLNSPALCASFCCVGLLTSMRLKSAWKYPGMVVLAAALVLTMVRTVWISSVLLMVLLAWKLYGRRVLRVLIALPVVALLLAVVALPLMHSDQGSAMGDRFSSLKSLDKDDSYVVRRMGMDRAMTVISSHPFGEGMGFMESPLFGRSIMGSVSSLGAHDIGALEIPFELGYLGTAFYLAAMAMALVKMLRRKSSPDSTRPVLLAIALNTCLLFASTNPLIAYDGILFWLAAGLLLPNEEDAVPPSAPVITVLPPLA